MWARAIPTGNWWRPERRHSRALLMLLFFTGGSVMAGAMTVAAAASLEGITYDAIPGWAGVGHSASLAAFRRSCAEILVEGRAFQRPIKFGGVRADWLSVCAKASATDDPLIFFEANFTPLKVNDPARPEGLFTGYFEPEAR